MIRVVLPQPPNPDDAQFRNPLVYNRAIFDWGNRIQQAAANAINNNAAPASTPFSVTSYSTNTVLSGTSTGTDIANALCSLIAALTAKGILITN